MTRSKEHSSDAVATGEVLTEDVGGGVRLLTLNRPHVLNALSTQMFDKLRDAFVKASADADVHCVVLTGRGRAFCVGIDLHDISHPAVGRNGKRQGFVPCIEEIERFPKPLVAAVNGLAVGFGATVIGHCDVALASTNARFRYPFAPLGLAPEAGSSALLPMQVGPQHAARLLFTGAWLEAEDALAMGLVSALVDPTDLQPRVLELATGIAIQPLPSLMITKKLLLAARLARVREARRRELDAYATLVDGEAHRRAIATFFGNSGK